MVRKCSSGGAARASGPTVPSGESSKLYSMARPQREPSPRLAIGVLSQAAVPPRKDSDIAVDKLLLARLVCDGQRRHLLRHEKVERHRSENDEDESRLAPAVEGDARNEEDDRARAPMRAEEEIKQIDRRREDEQEQRLVEKHSDP